MDRFLHFNSPTMRCKQSRVYLACAWISGLAAGIFCSLIASDSLFPTMRAAVRSCVSIFGLLSAILLPLLFSAFAVYISQPWLLIPIAFVKMFSFSFLALGVTAAYGSAGWLVRWLLMFSDSLMLPVLWWYWAKSLDCRGFAAVKAVCAALTAALVIGSLDYCVISPFLAKLISI